mgnify:CR=1 FL=1
MSKIYKRNIYIYVHVDGYKISFTDELSALAFELLRLGYLANKHFYIFSKILVYNMLYIFLEIHILILSVGLYH